MNESNDAFEFPMLRKGIDFTVVVPREAIEGTTGRAMQLEDRKRWLNDNMDLVSMTADRIRPLRTPRGARVIVESRHVIAQGVPIGA
ncbi:hypothetical protein U1872_04175 [Sphingomonas sp. RB3P16]|uniref:hypothetical protein n=1 Tax=Parasphingomonas frigoris TaxID=3096163 RepID=UPI002FCAE7A4